MADFDGKTVAYAGGVCASGGYLIACECDLIVAHPEARVGSIGVIASRPNISGLADELGISYERYVAGEKKDAGSPLKEPTEDDREVVQSLVDGLYDSFVETVASHRGLDPDEVRDTEARVFLAETAVEHDLVDELMAYDELLEELCSREFVDAPDPEEAEIEEYETPPGLGDMVSASAQQVAHAAGEGMGNALASGADDVSIEYR